MCDPSCASESIELFKDNYLLTKESMKWFWQKFKNNDDTQINKNKVFVYFKNRSPDDLNYITKYLEQKNIEFIINSNFNSNICNIIKNII